MDSTEAHKLSRIGLHRAARVIRQCRQPGATLYDGGHWQQIEREQPHVFRSALAMLPMGRTEPPKEVANVVVSLWVTRRRYWKREKMSVVSLFADIQSADIWQKMPFKCSRKPYSLILWTLPTSASAQRYSFDGWN